MTSENEYFKAGLDDSESDKKMADDLANLRTPPMEQLENLFPSKDERERILKIMEQVKNETDKEKRKAIFEAGVKKLGESCFNALEKMIYPVVIVLSLVSASSAQMVEGAKVPQTILMAMQDVLSRPRAAYTTTFKDKVAVHSASAYFPLRSFHKKGAPGNIFFELGVGVEAESRQKPRPFLALPFNIGESIRRLFSGGYLRDRTSGPDMSSIFFGPVVKFPFDDVSDYVIGENIGFIFAAKISGK